MENKNGQGIFMGVVGVATLIVTIIGATFAFFSASTNSDPNAIAVGATTLGLDYAETKLLKTDLIPATEAIATYAALKQDGTNNGNARCVDDVGNSVCSVYQFTVTNPSDSTAQSIFVSLNVVTNSFKNLKYKIYEGSNYADLDDDDIKVATATFLASDAATNPLTLTGLNTTLTAGSESARNSVTYTMVMWIDEQGADNSNDVGASFSAGINVSTGNGRGVTGVIANASSTPSGE